MRCCRHLPILLFAVLLAIVPPLHAEPQYILKFATLAPEGTTWVQLLQEWADQVKAESQGRLEFRIYPGGVQGDEPDVLKKIRFGQLQGGAFTGYGIGHIYSPARILEMPFLFENLPEIDFVRARLMPEIRQGFRDNGFELMGWMEVGYIYFFSQQRIASLNDLKKCRIWYWQGDPLGKAFFDASGLAPVPLSIIDVYTSLSTGMIDTVYTPPLGAIALQWFAKTHYITDVPMANGIGALIVSRKFYRNLPQDLQKLLMRTGEETGAKLVAATRKDNAEAMQVLLDRGMVLVKDTDSLKSAQVRDIADKATQSLMDSGYLPADLVHRVQGWLQEYRAGSAQPDAAH
jgi:TRAP-type C4-dicarboxylate transport system substrate-binding protein